MSELELLRQQAGKRRRQLPDAVRDDRQRARARATIIDTRGRRLRTSRFFARSSARSLARSDL